MCQYTNEVDNRIAFLMEVVDQKDRRIEELEDLVDALKMEIEDLEEYRWMYQDLCE